MKFHKCLLARFNPPRRTKGNESNFEFVVKNLTNLNVDVFVTKDVPLKIDKLNSRTICPSINKTMAQLSAVVIL